MTKWYYIIVTNCIKLKIPIIFTANVDFNSRQENVDYVKRGKGYIKKAFIVQFVKEKE